MLLVALPAHAGRQDHRGGFFLRLSTGLGPARTSIDDSPRDYELSGLAVDANIAIGGIVAPNLALHGTLFGWSVDEPDLEEDGRDLGELPRAELTLGGVGFGMTYYFMPTNLYLSWTLGLASLELDTGRLAADTGTGIGFDFTLGKEWWVSHRWALGVSGGLGVHSLPEDGTDENWTGFNFAVRFSATFN